MQVRQITPSISVADQPTAEELAALKAEGYVGVVNLRHSGEPDQPIQPAEEGEQLRALGLDYLHHGVGGTPLDEAGVETVLGFLDRNVPGKVLVHCKLGGRAAALVLIHQARANGWSPERAFEEGENLGLNVTGKLRGMVEDYLTAHPGPATS